MSRNRLKYAFVPALVLTLTAGAMSRDIVPAADLEGADPEAVVKTPEELLADSLARVDSLEIALTDSLNEAATAAYKNLKIMQYDGITDAELYPMAMGVYRGTLTAIDAPRTSAADLTRHRGVFRDLSPLLMRGAVYYYNNNLTDSFIAYSRAHVDLRLNPLMADVDLGSKSTGVYPSLAYSAASGAYNAKDYPAAITYLREYLRTGEKQNRESVYAFLGQAAINADCREEVVPVIMAGAEEYPGNFNLSMMALKLCQETGDTENLEPLLNRLLMVHPNDEQLLALRARLLEDEGKFSEALGYYDLLLQSHPNSLNLNRRSALCYYNLGVDHYNKSVMEADAKLSKKYRRQADAYFTTAADQLGRVVENDPSNATYLRALASTYACLGRTTELDDVNNHLTALGLSTVKVNAMPKGIGTASEKARSNAEAAESEEIPGFQAFAVDFVTKELADWSQMGEYEKKEDFLARVNETTILRRQKELSKKAEEQYLAKYAKRLRISEMKLGRYDSENESYKITTPMGDFVLRVPLKNDEAQAFRSGWETTRIRAPKFFIQNNRVAIKEITLETSAGKTYAYSSEKAPDYDGTIVEVDVAGIVGSNRGNTSSGASESAGTQVIYAKSDVDENIPYGGNKRADKTLALIIANENYSDVSKVDYALHDGQTFAEYCRKTLGLPEHQVLVFTDATYGKMNRALSQVKHQVSAMGDDVDLIVYYAGHGFPDEASRDAYLLPTDGDGATISTAFPLKEFYATLASSGAENVMVFLDACFSGSARNDKMLRSARGVALKPKDAAPEGNMFVLSAAGDSETALPYRAKYHGIFTYYLLKKIQESKGKVSLKELSDYVTESVRKNSFAINGKNQSPRVSVSGRLSTVWDKKKLRD